MARVALVTGSAGHLGSHVALSLLQAGWDVRGLDVRGHTLGELAWHERFEPIVADVRDVDAVVVAARGASVVFHLAMRREPADRRTDDAATRDLAIAGLDAAVEATRRSGTRTRLVYTSSTAAVGASTRADAVRTEADWNDDPVTPYQCAKVQAERRLWQEHGRRVDAVAVLPSMVIGPDDPTGTASNARVRQMLERPWQPFWFEGGLNVVDVRDAALGHLLAFEGGPRGHRYVLGGRNLTFRELITAARRIRGRLGQPAVRVPDQPLLAAVRLAERVARAAGRRPFVTARELEKRLGAHAYVSSEKARRELGYSTRPLSVTLWDLAVWLESRRR